MSASCSSTSSDSGARSCRPWLTEPRLPVSVRIAWRLSGPPSGASTPVPGGGCPGPSRSAWGCTPATARRSSSSWRVSWAFRAAVAATPISTATRTTSATVVRTSREVRDAKRARIPCSARRLEHVAGAPHRVDHRAPAGVDLLAQVGDVELDDVGLAAEVVVPHPVQDLRLGQHPLGVAHEEAQQLELGGGELDELVGAADLVAVLVEHEVADVEGGLALGLSGTGPAHQRTQPGHDLLQREGLG